MSRARNNYIRDSRGRFAPTPGKRVTSALGEAQTALDSAGQGIREIGEVRTAQARRTIDPRQAKLRWFVGACFGGAGCA